MAVTTGNRTQTILVKMLCGIFDMERDNCWKIWKGMDLCAFVALDDGMDL